MDGSRARGGRIAWLRVATTALVAAIAPLLAGAAIAPPDRPVEVETIDVPNDLPAFVLRPRRNPFARIVFLHGRCTHALGYVQAFQFAAAERGEVVAPQGDLPCGGAFRRWSGDLDRLEARIEAALRAAGDDDAAAWRDVVLVGYSEGAARAEALAARFPERYTRVVLIGGPSTPDASRLRRLKAAVTMAGTLDRQAPMIAGARALARAGVRAEFLPIAGARHGQMGDGERVMRDAFAFLFAGSP